MGAALAISAVVIQFHPSADFNAYWIMAGFVLIAANLIAAFLLQSEG